jgi:hypothetical protein
MVVYGSNWYRSRFSLGPYRPQCQRKLHKECLFFVHSFEENITERPHLLDGFSPILIFSGYILCLFVDGV